MTSLSDPSFIQSWSKDAALRLEVEDFLYMEAALLDEWRLDEWVALFTEDARYVVPTTDLPEGDPKENLVFIDDDIVRLRARVVRLNSRHAHREYPWSRTRRFISNVRITGIDGDEVSVTGSCLVYRVRMRQADPYVARFFYRLVRTGSGPGPVPVVVPVVVPMLKAGSLGGKYATAGPNWIWRRWTPTVRSALSCDPALFGIHHPELVEPRRA